MDSLRLWRLAEVQHRTGLSRSTIYALIQRSEFPPQIKLTARAVAWDSGEIERWAHHQIAIRDEALRPVGEQLTLKGMEEKGAQTASRHWTVAGDSKGGAQ